MRKVIIEKEINGCIDCPNIKIGRDDNIFNLDKENDIFNRDDICRLTNKYIKHYLMINDDCPLI